MAFLFPLDRRASIVPGPFTLSQLTRLVGGRPQLTEIASGDYLISAEDSHLPLNRNATDFTGNRPTPIYGDAILCSPDELS